MSSRLSGVSDTECHIDVLGVGLPGAIGDICLRIDSPHECVVDMVNHISATKNKLSP